jgi:hypothetical protein
MVKKDEKGTKYKAQLSKLKLVFFVMLGLIVLFFLAPMIFYEADMPNGELYSMLIIYISAFILSFICMAKSINYLKQDGKNWFARISLFVSTLMALTPLLLILAIFIFRSGF